MQIENVDPELTSPNATPVKFRPKVFALLILFGLGYAILAAIFVSQGQWILALALIALFPAIAILSRYPFVGVLIWLLVMPFSSALPGSGLIYWAVYRILPPVLLFFAVFSRLVKAAPHPPARFGPPELGMLILGLVVPGTILLANGNSSLALIRFGDRVLLPFCMYLVVRMSAPREREILQLQWVVLFIALSQSLIGFLSWYAPQRLPEIWHYLQGARTTGSVKDPDLYAALLSFSGALLVYVAIYRKSGLIRFGFFLASGLCAIFTFLSLERAAWLGEVFVIVGLIFLFPKVMLRLMMIGSVIAVILGSGVLSSHLALSVSRFSESDPVFDRLVVFDAMSQMFQMKPVLGWGYETLDDNIQHFYREFGEASILRRLVTSHNTYFTVLTELGLVGFTLYMFPVVWWLVLTMRVWSRMPKEGLWSRGLLGVLWLVLLFQFTVSNFFDMRWFEIGLTLWWLTLGMIANMVYPYLKDRTPGLPALIEGG